MCVGAPGGGAADVLILMEGGWWRDGRASNCQVIMHKVPTLPYLKLSVPTREFLDHFHWCNGAINQIVHGLSKRVLALVSFLFCFPKTLISKLDCSCCFKHPRGSIIIRILIY